MVEPQCEKNHVVTFLFSGGFKIQTDGNKYCATDDRVVTN